MSVHRVPGMNAACHFHIVKGPNARASAPDVIPHKKGEKLSMYAELLSCLSYHLQIVIPKKSKGLKSW